MAVEEIQTAHPGIFGPQGGNSRAVGIANMSWTLGIFFGPIISGTLSDYVGYLEMNTVLGKIFPPNNLVSVCPFYTNCLLFSYLVSPIVFTFLPLSGLSWGIQRLMWLGFWEWQNNFHISL